jgi:hypothetical protein
VTIDSLGHATFEQLEERVPSGAAVVLAPFHALGMHDLHHPKQGCRISVAVCGIGGHLAGLINSAAEYPL